MTLANTSFETGDANPSPPFGSGSAATGWTVTFVSTGSEFANFGDATVTEGAERFERNWSSNETFIFTLDASLSPAVFNPGGPYASTSDGFEALWSSDESFNFDLGRLELFNFGSTLLGAESFEREWSSNESFKWAFVPEDLIVGLVEDFEFGDRVQIWPDPHLFARFDGTSPQSVEDFEQVDANLWIVYIGDVVQNDNYSVTIEGQSATYHSSASETQQTLANALIARVNNMGGHFTASLLPLASGFYLSLNEHFANDPSLDIATLLSDGGSPRVDSPNGSVLTLQRVDATVYWTQASKLFSI